MRWTPHALVALGLILICWGYYNVHVGIMSEGVSKGVARAAVAVEAGMSEDEMHRVFGMPVGASDPRAWFEGYFGLFWARAVQSTMAVNSLGAAALGIGLCVWGIVEGRCRGRRDPVTGAPFDERTNGPKGG